MKRSTLRAVILVTGLITALIHLVLLNISMGKIDPLFTLNGLGYLALLAALFLNLPVVSKQQPLVHWAFMTFTAVTILAFIVIAPRPYTPLGYITKLDEIVLIAALYMHLRATA
jgi:ABC-type microcin C transport system permease subunit YejB